MIDLDHFKAVNDGHGHPMGDEVLQQAAAAARACRRASDVLVRYGGEEFLAVLPGADERCLPQVAERIRAAVGATACEGQRGVVQVTASIGAAAVPACGAATADELLECADDALYRANLRGLGATAWSSPARSRPRPRPDGRGRYSIPSRSS